MIASLARCEPLSLLIILDAGLDEAESQSVRECIAHTELSGLAPGHTLLHTDTLDGSQVLSNGLTVVIIGWSAHILSISRHKTS